MDPREYSLLPVFYFSVYIAGESISFEDVSGISVEITYDEIQSGGENSFKYKLPNGPKWDKLVLKRGLIKDNSAFSAWVKGIVNDSFEVVTTKKIMVHLMDKTHNPVHSWEFQNAYPISWKTNSFNSTKNEIAVEEIAFVFTQAKRL